MISQHVLYRLAVYFFLFVFVPSHLHSEKSFDWAVQNRGRTYRIKSVQKGTSLSFGRRWLYAPAPLLPSPSTNNQYVLLFITCRNENPCKTDESALYKATSSDGITYSPPVELIRMPPIAGVYDLVAPRVIRVGSLWHVYAQGRVSSGSQSENRIYLAMGASLEPNQLTWLSNAVLTPTNPFASEGIGEDHQWFNAIASGGDPAAPIFGVYNDWNLGGYLAGYLQAVKSVDGVATNFWYGPIAPGYWDQVGVKFPDVILKGTFDASTKGDPSFTLGDGCFPFDPTTSPEGSKFRPITGLFFFNHPNLYRSGQAPFTPADSDREQYGSGPQFNAPLIETNGPFNSGFRPRFARNEHGYLDPVSTTPRRWKTFVYYNNSQINQQATNGCPSQGFSINGYQQYTQSFGVSEVEITEEPSAPELSLIQNVPYSSGTATLSTPLSLVSNQVWSSTVAPPWLWLSTTPSSGTGATVIQVSAQSNYSPDLPRTGYVRVQAASQDLTTRFTQAPASLGADYQFTDVPCCNGVPGDQYDINGTMGFANYIALAKRYLVTLGTGSGAFTPEGTITRIQVAAMLVRAVLYRNGDYLTADPTNQASQAGGYPKYDTPVPPGKRWNPSGFTWQPLPTFSDVQQGDQFFEEIQKLAELGISDVDGGNFRPWDFVTRAEMAEMIIRAMVYKNSLPQQWPYITTPYFPDDVPSSHPKFNYIQKLRQEGITSGTALGKFTPSGNLLRSQMAVFIIRGILTPQP